MLENLEALRVLAQTGTMTEAATRLRLTQSAVSKRIAALERETGKRLIEPAGRRVQLTPAALRLLERTDPLLAELRSALTEEGESGRGRIVLGVSESILCSWGPRVLAGVRARLPGLELVLNAHRSLTAIDRVRSGDYMLALCAGLAEADPQLKAAPLLEEPMIILPSRLDREALSSLESIPVMTIEPHSATWGSLERRLRRFSREGGARVQVSHTIQSFPCLVQLACAGFGHALVPLEVARSFGIPASMLYFFPEPGLWRPVSLVGRASTFARPAVERFLEVLKAGVEGVGNVVPGSWQV